MKYNLPSQTSISQWSQYRVMVDLVSSASSGSDDLAKILCLLLDEFLGLASNSSSVDQDVPHQGSPLLSS